MIAKGVAHPLRRESDYPAIQEVLQEVFEDTVKSPDPSNNTNPKDVIGSSKLPLSLWSPLATAYGTIGLLNGMKYGLGNYKASKVQMSIYLDAILRHTMAIIEGQENDPVDGVPHFSAILANVAIILEARACGTLVDDRPLTGGYVSELEKLTKIANSVKQLHKDSKYKHYTIEDTPECRKN